MSNRYSDLMKQGFMKPLTKESRRADVSDVQFRENIRLDVARRTRIMFGEEEA